MTYWIIMFVQPVPVPNPGPLKYKLTRARYEAICTMDAPVVDCDKGNFSLISKRVFSIEEDNAAYIVADVIKNRKE